MKKILFLLLATVLTFNFSYSQDKKKSSKKAPEQQMKNLYDSVSYSIGVTIATNLKKEGFDSINTELMKKAILDFYSGKAKIDEEQANNTLLKYYEEMKKMEAQKNLKEGEKFLEENKKKPGVVTLPSGLQYIVLKEGTGPKPTVNDIVTTHYHGTFINGEVFDSSIERGQPVKFPVNGVIPGWVEALQLMNVGSKFRLFIPSSLAYGEHGAGGVIEPNTLLIFEVELLGIN
jgi:FKBP-type peptidyl-prolyl cis-trans isomerase FklB